ncbi:MAG: hypothetical protein EOO80_12105 [Oxalobacteraceae bacterium]|nr:MAG: hypothetical protein EOO80_12105 [Oxalobacteraceae bacterium]
MGAAGRRKVEREFDEALVIGKYLDAIASAGIRRPYRGELRHSLATPRDNENMEIKRRERHEF